MKLIDFLVKCGLSESKSKARRLIKAGAVRLLDSNYRLKTRLTDPKMEIRDDIKWEKI